MKDPRKLPFREAPGLVPIELLGKRIACDECKAEISVPWLEKLNFPAQPIERSRGGEYCVPVGMPLKCDKCGYEMLVDVPRQANEGKWSLYGDEAGRYIKTPNETVSRESLHFFCITLVGLHKDSHSKVKSEIEKAKMALKPDVLPSSWVHHFTDIWSSSPLENKYGLKNKELKIEYGIKFAKIISNARPALVSFTVSDCIIVPNDEKKRKKAIRDQKQKVFCQAILTTLRRMRSFNKSVCWTFDNIKDSSSKNRTEGWASESFLGLQYTRLFTWLSAGAIVLEPEFVKPGSHYLLEIADFISFCIAREFDMAAKKTENEFPSTLLGSGFYQGTLRDGEASEMWNNAFPLDEFYGLQTQTNDNNRT